ncbi:type II toxin-antitoxin system CcdA family antitoxin [Paraburkholderia sp. BCC1885]|uniref:type II toxin-antitoxin system CcdA family antitoxin n=1 Tax=Paraburkholderia sp. BCC1885 TaxID=2562669 RepID=UPI001181FABB|nr:type II toxin-antitoxin system CcdA family antitoxin [Paraburkholderia sp. BCC1885]
MATIKVLRPDDFLGGENDGDNPMTALGREVGPSDGKPTGADEWATRWQKENAEAIACYNDYIEKNGLPLDEFRIF